MTVCDLSNWDYSTFDPNCLHAAGVDRVIVGCWDLNVTLDIVARCRAAGIIVEDLYTFLYYNLPWETQEVDNALAVQANLHGIKRVWLDCEAGFSETMPTETADTTVAYRVEATLRERRRLRDVGFATGIYTGEPWWRSKMANSDAFASDPLWLANYGWNDPEAPRSPIRTVSFGGWTATAAHQYNSRIVVCGRERDHNYWFLEEDDGMTEAQIKELIDNAIAAQFLPLLRQVVGVDPSTFSDEPGRQAVLAALQCEEHTHEPGRVVRPPA